MTGTQVRHVVNCLNWYSYLSQHLH